jgi:cytochrome c biogenesis protein CcdA
MILFLLAYLGGVLTIVSPCILPVIPFVLARADRPFLRNGLPMLIGMTLAFAVVASFASVAGGWVVSANQYGRLAALVLLAVFGLTLLFPAVADRLMQPLVSVGARLSQSAEGNETLLAPLVLGIATGFLWAPCAGPVLGLILTGAALQGANFGTALLLLTYAAGAATSLALALLVGGRVFAAMKKSIRAGEWVRRGLGAAVLVAVVAIGLGADTGFLTNLGRRHHDAGAEPPRQAPSQPEDGVWTVDDQAGHTIRTGQRGVAGRRPHAVAGRRARMAELTAAQP